MWKNEAKEIIEALKLVVEGEERYNKKSLDNHTQHGKINSVGII